VYTCGESSGTELRTVNTNRLAIYTTTPDKKCLNLIKFTSDRVNWGFTNNIHKRINNETAGMRGAGAERAATAFNANKGRIFVILAVGILCVYH